jgi:hypothetical protein
LDGILPDDTGQSHLNKLNNNKRKAEGVIKYIQKAGGSEMEENDRRDLESLFEQVEDPRVERTKRHRRRDIIILAICGVLCGADGGSVANKKLIWYCSVN